MEAEKTNSPSLAGQRCWMQGRRVYVEIDRDRAVSFPTSKYDTLAYASQVELEKIRLDEDGRTIRWENIDEEILVDDVANQRFAHTPNSLLHTGAGKSGD